MESLKILSCLQVEILGTYIRRDELSFMFLGKEMPELGGLNSILNLNQKVLKILLEYTSSKDAIWTYGDHLSAWFIWTPML